MKNRIILILLFIFISHNIYSLSLKPYFASANVEANMNSYDRIAAGIGIENCFSLSENWISGISLKLSTDFAIYTSPEILLSSGYLFTKSFFTNKAKFYIGALVGYEQIWANQECIHTISVGIDGKMIYKITEFENNNLCLIPYFRVGYPYLWGIGISVGVIF